MEEIEELSDRLTEIAAGAGKTFFGDFFGKGLSYISQVVVARLLGAQLFGLYALGLTVYKFTSLIAQLGLNNGIIHFVPKYQGNNNPQAARGTVLSGLLLSFSAGVLLATGIYFSAPWVAETIFNDASFAGVLRTYSFGIPFFALMMVALYSTRAQKVMKYFVYVKNFQLPTLFLLMFALFYLFGLRLYGAVGAWVAATFIAGVTAIVLLREVYPDLLSGSKTYEIPGLFKFSLPLVMVGALQFLILWTDTFMLGALRTATDVGLYRAAVQTALLLGMVLRAFNSIFAPMISDLHNRNELGTLNSLFKLTTRWIVILTIPLFVLLLVSGDSVLRIFGASFTVAWLPLILLGFAQLMDASMGPVGYILIMSGNERLEFRNVLAVGLLNVLLNYIMIPRFNMIGAALATGTSVVVVNLARLLEVDRVLNLWPYNRSFLKPLFGFILGAFSGLFWRFFGPELFYLFDILVGILLVGVVFFGTVFSLGLKEADKTILMAGKKFILDLLAPQ